MNAYELADELEDVDAPRYREIAANILRQQADRIAELEKQIEHYKNKAEYLDKRELELLAEVNKYKQVLQTIANEYPELSDHKIQVQNRNHIKWAREVLDEN